MQSVRGRPAGTRHPVAMPPGGFTLVELIVTVSVLAILTTIAVPSFSSLLNSNRLTGAANDLVGGLQAARLEAVRRNQVVTFCKSADNATCAGNGSGSWAGWIVLATDGTLLQSGILKEPVEFRPSSAISSNRIVFRPDGFARAPGATTMLSASFGICIPTTRPEENMRTVRIMAGSRISVEREDQDGECPNPGNS